MPLTPSVIKELHELFTAELEDQSRIMIDSLIQLEKGPASLELQQQLLEQIFRSAHNVKGAARGVELHAISDIAHQLETLFSRIKQSNGPVSADCIDFSLQTIDLMQKVMVAQNNNEQLPVDIEHLKERVLATDVVKSGAEVSLSKQSARQSDTTQRPSEPPQNKAQVADERIKKPYVEPRSRSKAGQKEVPTQPQNNENTPTKVTETAKSPPPVTTDDSQRLIIGSEFVRLKMDRITEIDGLSEEIQISKIEMERHLEELTHLTSECMAMSSHWYRAPVNEDVAGCLLATDELVGHYDEGMDFITRIEAKINYLYKTFRVSANQLKTHCNALQSSVRMLRLVPASSLLHPITRIVRDIARALDKDVQFVTTGNNIEVDRAVLEGLKDPLMHLLRNAIDHGLEDADNRKISGKPLSGNLAIHLRREGSEIVITVEDDGGGIDLQMVKALALDKKLFSSQELDNMSDVMLTDILFMPGFSTKDIITEVSGRGVGLDVVRSRLSALKGKINVTTELGKGTSFVLRVPLTMATEHGLLLRLGSSKFVIPSQAIERVMELKASEIIDIEGGQAIYHDEKTIPLCALSSILQIIPDDDPSRDIMPVILISKRWSTVAVMVDEILGESEIIVKPLMPPLVAVQNISGGAMMGNGEVVMVLDTDDIVEQGLHSGNGQRKIQSQNETQEKSQSRLLVVDDSMTVRTLERNILQNEGYKVKVATDGRQAWNILQEEDFDLVVTDVEMPNMDGFELTERIKTSDLHRHIPVIIVTSLSFESDKQQGIEAGANAYITKGQFDSGTLLGIVEQLLGSHNGAAVT